MTDAKDVVTSVAKRRISRRSVLASAAAAGVAAGVGPHIIKALGETPVKIGFIDPFTGTYAMQGDSEQAGARMAIAEINAAGGMLGRKVEIILEDDAADVGKATVKFHKLVEQNKVDFISGSVSSAVSLALEHASGLKGILYVDTGGHVDSVTGTHCNWTTFKVCSDTWMLASALVATLMEKFGKKWYFITPDYAWGHFLHANCLKILKQHGGEELGNALLPLGTTDFTSALIKIREAKPNVCCVLNGGDDFVNTMKQATQFGMTKEMAFGYPLAELEALAALPPVARTGWGVMEWYWQQPGNAHVAAFVEKYRKLYTKTPSARSWFGYVAMQTIAMATAKAKSLNSVKVAKAIEGMELPPDVALGPYPVAWRAADHQLLITEFVGEVNGGSAKYPDLFDVKETLAGPKLAESPAAKGCKMTYPA